MGPEKVYAEIGDLYRPLADPKKAKTRQKIGNSQFDLPGQDFDLHRQRNLTLGPLLGTSCQLLISGLAP